MSRDDAVAGRGPALVRAGLGVVLALGVGTAMWRWPSVQSLSAGVFSGVLVFLSAASSLGVRPLPGGRRWEAGDLRVGLLVALGAAALLAPALFAPDPRPSAMSRTQSWWALGLFSLGCWVLSVVSRVFDRRVLARQAAGDGR